MQIIFLKILYWLTMQKRNVNIYVNTRDGWRSKRINVRIGEHDMIISERIFKILQDKHMSQSAFAKKVGLPGSTISDWKTKKTNPTAEKIMAICKVLEVTPEQLLTGKGVDEDYVEIIDNAEEKFVITNTDMRILEDYHSLKDEQRKRLLKYMDALKQIEELEEMR